MIYVAPLYPPLTEYVLSAIRTELLCAHPSDGAYRNLTLRHAPDMAEAARAATAELLHGVVSLEEHPEYVPGSWSLSP